MNRLPGDGDPDAKKVFFLASISPLGIQGFTIGKDNFRATPPQKNQGFSGRPLLFSLNLGWGGFHEWSIRPNHESSF